jgi:hypothetical protein
MVTWGEDGRSAARLSLLLDHPYLAAYSVFQAAACVKGTNLRRSGLTSCPTNRRHRPMRLGASDGRSPGQRHDPEPDEPPDRTPMICLPCWLSLLRVVVVDVNDRDDEAGTAGGGWCVRTSAVRTQGDLVSVSEHFRVRLNGV